MKIYIRGRDCKMWRFYCTLEKSMHNKVTKFKENGLIFRSRHFETRDFLPHAIWQWMLRLNSLIFLYHACSYIDISYNICTLWYTAYEIYQLLYVSALKCHSQKVIIKYIYIYNPICKSRFCPSLQEWLKC
jgi:hypothetical protein